MRCKSGTWRKMVGTLVLAAAFGAPVFAEQAGVGDRAVLAGTLLDGTRFDIAKDRGRVVIVDFWATWCTPCRAEMPVLAAFRRAHAGDVVVIGVSEDGKDAFGKVREAMAPLDYPTATLYGLTANGFGHPHVLPVAYLVGRDGVVRAILRPSAPPLTAAGLAAAVGPLLKEAPPPR